MAKGEKRKVTVIVGVVPLEGSPQTEEIVEEAALEYNRDEI